MVFIGGFIRGLETVLEPDELEVVKRTLLTSANNLERGDFHNLDVSASAFGGSETANELGFHHGLAHQVIADTLAGVTADMRDFREGVVRAEAMLNDADAVAGSDLSRQEAAVAELEDANRWFDGDHKYAQARNEHGGDRG
ncbi:MAG TPA: hypothetical protein VLO09_04745 [Ornithinimicrobium sp.]|nr:hypothetical protein [Ornithinimicrobium sp.]